MLNRHKDHDRVSPAMYRDAMSRFAGAVNVVTTDGIAGKRGVTVSAAVSVSDNPPTIFVCLNRNREENRWFERNGVFCVNTLVARQEPVARAFAGEGKLPMDERFALGQWTTLSTGAPVLTGSRMVLDCVVSDVQLVHTHYVVAGEVVACGELREEEALVYLDRQYHSVR